MLDKKKQARNTQSNVSGPFLKISHPKRPRVRGDERLAHHPFYNRCCRSLMPRLLGAAGVNDDDGARDLACFMNPLF